MTAIIWRFTSLAPLYKLIQKHLSYALAHYIVCNVNRIFNRVSISRTGTVRTRVAISDDAITAAGSKIW
jgi:hypothetical protein